MASGVDAPFLNMFVWLNVFFESKEVTAIIHLSHDQNDTI